MLQNMCWSKYRLMDQPLKKQSYLDKYSFECITSYQLCNEGKKEQKKKKEKLRKKEKRKNERKREIEKKK